MADNNEEEEEAGDIQLNEGIKTKSFDAYVNLPRGLTSEELSQTGTQKLILNDLTKAETTIRQLSPYQKQYYQVLTEKKVLDEKLAKTKRAEILYSFCITIGGLLIGIGKSTIATDSSLGIILIVIGGFLIIGGALFKIIWK